MEIESKEKEMDVRLRAALETYAEGDRGDPAGLVFQRVREKFRFLNSPHGSRLKIATSEDRQA